VTLRGERMWEFLEPSGPSIRALAARGATFKGVSPQGVVDGRGNCNYTLWPAGDQFAGFPEKRIDYMKVDKGARG